MVTAHPIPTHPQFIDLTGRTFGRLGVLGYAGRNRSRHASWNCRCTCGRECVVETASLRNGHTRSCGCLKNEATRDRSTTHGHARVGKKSPEYRSWVAMLGRCTQPRHEKFPDYGGRGIRVCDRWLVFEHFLADMGKKPSPRHTIERADNDGNYEPGNCRWATAREQGANKRNNRLLAFGGLTMTVTQWERHLGFPRSLLQGRLRLGWPVKKAINTPPGQ